jgi:integrase
LKNSGKTRARLRHEQFVEAYRRDLQRRADAGEIRQSTVTRYHSALAHYVSYVASHRAAAAGPYATGVNRTLAQGFSAFLATALVSPNGTASADKRRMLSPEYVIDVVRGLYAWGTDPDRGNLLPEAFRNPFAAKYRKPTRGTPCLVGEPDITVKMAGEFLGECDLYQLRLFTLLGFYGLRAAEPCYLFHEYVSDESLTVPCAVQLDYLTKGRQDKTFPLLAPLRTLLIADRPADERGGLLFLRRSVLSGTEQAPLRGRSLQALVREYQRRVQALGTPTARDRDRLRDQVLKEAGALNYDRIEHEFRAVADRLKWPKQATMKDFRHGFATGLSNAGVPEPYRKYLMGQSAERAAISRYTHLNQVREQYLKAVDSQWSALLRIVTDRLGELTSA